MSDKHIIDTDHMGLIECPVKQNKTGWTWEADGYEGRTPENCPVCGEDGVEWFRLDYDLTPVFYAPRTTLEGEG